jgi:hypothetical protein
MQKESHDAPYGASAPFAMEILHAAHLNREALRLHRRKKPVLTTHRSCLERSCLRHSPEPRIVMTTFFYFDSTGMTQGQVTQEHLPSLARQRQNSTLLLVLPRINVDMRACFLLSRKD